MRKLTLGILAHVDSGKTTLSEALLYKAGAIRSLGRVDHRDTLLDCSELERKRGITIFSKQAHFTTGEFDINLIDTPGHVDFCAETERTLSILDAAILVISGSGGVQSHTTTLWNLLRKHNIPTFIFVNKMDMPNADKETLLSGMHKKLSASIVPMENLNNCEELALCSEILMDKFLSHGIDDKDIQREIKSCKVFPCIFGSALKLLAIDDLLEAIDKYAPKKDYKEKLGAVVYKVGHNDADGKITYIKLTGGNLSVKDAVSYYDKDGNEICEKITGLRIYQGDKFVNVQEIKAGSVAGVLGLSSLLPGDTLGFEQTKSTPTLVPILNYRVVFPKNIDNHTMLTKLRILEAEDPTLHVTYNDELSQICVLLMGEIQIETLKYEIKQRFGIEVEFCDGGIVYKETIKGQVEGIGHYEPLRHYSEVHLLVTELPRGSGLVFDSDCDTDFFEKNWQRLVLSHLEEKIHIGVLTGSAITDMKITLVSGRAHKKHTEGGDFRQATYRAVRQGLMKAQSVLLEPYYSYEISVPSENIGRVMTDIQNMCGTLSFPDSDGEFSTVSGKAPVSKMRSYPKELSSFTKGLGTISLTFSGYDVCHNQEQVIQEIGYNPESDLANSPDSIFCESGSAVFVRWDEVESFMHLPSIFDVDKEEAEAQKELKRRAEKFCAAMATDKELMEIFERTYGKIKKREEPKTKFGPSARDIEVKKKAPKQKPSHMPTGPEYLLIDGYNIIFAWDELKKKAAASLEDARHELIERICNYQGFYGCEVILVFDAYKVHKNPGSVENFRNIKVVYTKEAQTADTYIEKTAHKLARDHIVRVATSDGPEQMIILGSGALRVPAAAFIKEITDAEDAIRQMLQE